MNIDKTILEKIEQRQDLTSAEKQAYIRYAITTHSGKMEGIPSISTSCKCNKYCKKRKENQCLICSKCYADSLIDFRKTLNKKLSMNSIFFAEYTINKKEVPLINSAITRFESFGDLQNEKHFKNYCTIASANKHCNFALWSKNPFIIKQALAEGTKIPENLQIIYSIPKINYLPPMGWNAFKKIIRKAFPFVKKVFTVYTKDFAKECKIDINCGSRNCMKCGKCYTKSDRHFVIRELLK